MAIKNKRIKKKKSQINGILKKKKVNFINEKENDLSDNPFMQKEEIKPFNLKIEHEASEDEVQIDKFKELLKRRIKQINKIVEKNKKNFETNKMYGDDIEKSGKSWYEDKLVNDVPRKLTII
ncbi:conserved Plasmodium protein, unknown function [Plasmodium gallinaceum]|uniref:Uncharacterized protein n=1 Tax=Plasmodium gallinaceum TaxID=5849 RepID=A0A1J1GQV1_PLAGA|nr:conserved Plasmodium protein, unknown function [Plasmodium gallinaceum]CRG94666.1 conserved Plasmodium protein, unknown function [Plasmodium gallinaceum]